MDMPVGACGGQAGERKQGWLLLLRPKLLSGLKEFLSVLHAGRAREHGVSCRREGGESKPDGPRAGWLWIEGCWDRVYLCRR